jgi:hypothetical protein
VFSVALIGGYYPTPNSPLRREEHVSLLDTRINGDNHLPRGDTAAQ